MSTTDLSGGNGSDRYLVSTGTPISDVLDHYEDTSTDPAMLLEDLNQVRLMVCEATRRTIMRAHDRGMDRDDVADLIGSSCADLLDEVWPA